jgi:broad specificity phosphatase PhoE
VRLLLVRHGQSVWNAERRFQGATDVPLSALGLTQARALGAALRDRALAAAYVSPVRRAAGTARIALEGRRVPLVVLDELRELSLGTWEGSTVEEVRSQAGDPYLAWLRAPHDRPPPGAEPLDAVLLRVERAVARIVGAHAEDDEVLVVAHGGLISLYACRLLGASFNDLWRLRVDNGSITVVKPPRLVTLNDTAHLGALRIATHIALDAAGGGDLGQPARPAAGATP